MDTVTTPDVLLAPDVGHDEDPVPGGPVQHVPAVTHALHHHLQLARLGEAGRVLGRGCGRLCCCRCLRCCGIFRGCYTVSCCFLAENSNSKQTKNCQLKVSVQINSVTIMLLIYPIKIEPTPCVHRDMVSVPLLPTARCSLATRPHTDRDCAELVTRHASHL